LTFKVSYISLYKNNTMSSSREDIDIQSKLHIYRYIKKIQ